MALNTDPASLYYLQMSYANFSRQLGFTRSDVAGVPSLDAYVKMYIPFGFSSGGWYRGVIPQVQAAVSNSLVTHGGLAPMNRISASIRGYVIGSTPPSAIYPRLGAGLEAGWSGRIAPSTARWRTTAAEPIRRTCRTCSNAFTGRRASLPGARAWAWPS